jgi:hypothetical protein
MKRYQAIELLRKLNELKSDKKYSKYVLFAIVKTLDSLDSIRKEIEEEEKKLYTEEYKTFNESRVSLLKVYSAKDENGQPIMEGEQVIIEEHRKPEFNEEFNKLVEANKETLEKFNEDAKTFDEYLNEETEVKLYKFDFKYLPDDLFPGEYTTLSKLLKED